MRHGNYCKADKRKCCAGKCVAGNLPFCIAVHARVVYVIEYVGDAPRGTEYTLIDMDKAGAQLRPYICAVAPKRFLDTIGGYT